MTCFRRNADVPVEANVAAILRQIAALLPTTATTTRSARVDRTHDDLTVLRPRVAELVFIACTSGVVGKRDNRRLQLSRADAIEQQKVR